MIHRTFPDERQMDAKDCGPACLKMIAKHFGKYYSLTILRDKCGITREGISLLDLSHAAESIGLRTLSVKCTIDELISKVPLPAVIHWDNDHFAVLYKVKGVKSKIGWSANSKIFLADPARGHINYSLDDFAKKWLKKDVSKGFLMAIEPTPNFYQMSAEKAASKKTLNNFLGYFIPYKKSFLQLFLVMLMVTVLQGLLPFISKAVIDIGIQTHDLDFINIVLVCNVAIVISVLLSNVVKDWILMHVAARINIALISDYLIKLMNLPLSFFENKMIGDILQRAQDHERIRTFIMNNSLNMMFSALTFIAFGIILLIYSPVIFYIFILGSLLYVAWVMGFLSVRKKLDWEYFDLVSKNQSYWVETIGSIQDIKINNYEKQKR